MDSIRTNQIKLGYQWISGKFSKWNIYTRFFKTNLSNHWWGINHTTWSSSTTLKPSTERELRTFPGPKGWDNHVWARYKSDINKVTSRTVFHWECQLLMCIMCSFIFHLDVHLMPYPFREWPRAENLPQCRSTACKPQRFERRVNKALPARKATDFGIVTRYPDPEHDLQFTMRSHWVWYDFIMC